MYICPSLGPTSLAPPHYLLLSVWHPPPFSPPLPPTYNHHPCLAPGPSPPLFSRIAMIPPCLTTCHVLRPHPLDQHPLRCAGAGVGIAAEEASVDPRGDEPQSDCLALSLPLSVSLSRVELTPPWNELSRLPGMRSPSPLGLSIYSAFLPPLPQHPLLLAGEGVGAAAEEASDDPWGDESQADCRRRRGALPPRRLSVWSSYPR